MVPYLPYRDAAGALRFLAEAFGFEVVVEVPSDGGALAHAEMRYGAGVLMLGTGAPVGARGAWALTPGHGVYVVVEDVDAHHARAVAAGAEIVWEPEETEFGTRRYRARDPEGYEWSFGSYRPGG